ncbi:metallophosphoesterase [Gloeocapsopsis dulcis]|uniref:Metallophosphoesterase n=1 Tax=Gloeocapsopsis dulcis AAB1 = 1H9 TaxID=1433147 RepID=A0A6N8G380_9CHRO|nr:metallophosphoesterase [Gloeocapsopsis dulcis]MUL39282.1 metallophosphoesterase [Gloeocapsopsis dulcis AAB1 = 1H9]
MKKIKYALLSLLGLIGAILIWGLLEPYLIDIEPQVAAIPGLPAAWEGQKVAVIGDWQVGMWLDNTSTIDRIVQRLVKERPAIALIIGDFIYSLGKNPSAEIRKAIELVRPLPASGIPTYAVLGNHDYGMKAKDAPPNITLATKLAESLEAVGVQVLKNEAVTLVLSQNQSQTLARSDRNALLYLVGVGAHWPNEDKPAVALAEVPDSAPRFVMMHHPESFALFPASSTSIAVAGHTHGGQIRLPFTPEWSWLTFTKEDRVHADGWIDGYGEQGNHLYVNRGIGFSILPIRINCPPEITLFTLRQVRKST